MTEAIAVALVSGLMTLLGVLVSNSRSRAVMEVKFDELRRQVEKHNSLIERTVPAGAGRGRAQERR